tara:strand:+ start:15645 stop:16451 length:807 start_codon:yes stop_codon:yes gene_type:complete
MAETLTYDAGSDTVTREDNLTEAEQESLKVGEALVEEQEGLLAGKYKNAQELEKAHIELQKKLGEKSSEKETEETEAETEEPEIKSTPAIDLINEASKEYYDNKNSLSAETIEKFSSLSSKDLVEAYVELQNNQPAPTENSGDIEVSDLTDTDINTIKNSVGGEKNYNDIISWAANNLAENQVTAFDNAVNTGDVELIKLAVSGLKAQYENNYGTEGTTLTGKAASSSRDVFRSQAEVVKAMSDPAYDRDPAYRADLIEKLERSNINF